MRELTTPERPNEKDNDYEYRGDYIEMPSGIWAFNNYRWKRFLLESDTLTGANMRLFQAWKRFKRSLFATVKYIFR